MSKKIKIPKQPEANIGTAGHVDHGKCITKNTTIIINNSICNSDHIISWLLKDQHPVSIGYNEWFFPNVKLKVLSFIDGTIFTSTGIPYIQYINSIVYYIETETGRFVGVTPNHPLLIYKNKKLCWLPAREIREDNLIGIYNRKLCFEKIIKVKKIKYNDYVLDIYVPKIHNFLTGDNIIAHNTTIIQALTGIWTSSHSEELRRGITIKIGYADMPIYEFKKNGKRVFWSYPEYPGFENPILKRVISFVDCPGHESLMANMLSGAAVMDGAILVIAANEPVPRPQTKEHAMALEILGVKNIVVVQNKVDLVDKEEAIKNYEQIKEFLSSTKYYADAPIIPISAIQKVNLEYLVEAIEKFIPTPKRDLSKPARMLVIRSFNVNYPGVNYKKLKGGVIGGSIIQGRLKVDDELEIVPGYLYKKGDKIFNEPLFTKVISLSTQHLRNLKEVSSGGLVGVQTDLDPALTKADGMVGNVAGEPGTLPPVLTDLRLNISLFRFVVGTDEQVIVKPLVKGEPLRINIGSAVALGFVTALGSDWAEIKLLRPVAAENGWKAAIARRFNGQWRLIGVGEVSI